MLLRALAVVLFWPISSAMVMAQSVGQPQIRVGDSWLFQQTLQTAKDGWKQVRYQLEVSRVTPSRIYYSVAQVGLARPPLELMAAHDWSVSKSVNGKETIVARPLDFPLKTGKDWKVELEEKENLGSESFRSRGSNLLYQVVGMENIDVPAGKFKAWKIEAEGNWTETKPAAASASQQTQMTANQVVTVTAAKKAGETTVTGRIYEAVWYSPETKNYVKYVKERFDPAGVRYFSDVRELVSFKEGLPPSSE
jgi:hypothetical protein